MDRAAIVHENFLRRTGAQDFHKAQHHGQGWMRKPLSKFSGLHV